MDRNVLESFREIEGDSGEIHSDGCDENYEGEMKEEAEEEEDEEEDEELEEEGDTDLEVQELKEVIPVYTEEGKQFSKEEPQTEKPTVSSRPLLRPIISKGAIPQQEEKPKDLRHMLRRSVSGVSLTGGDKETPKEEKPKDLRNMLRRTQSGVSLTSGSVQEEDQVYDFSTRPQLRGPTVSVIKLESSETERNRVQKQTLNATNNNNNNNNNTTTNEGTRHLLRRSISTASLPAQGESEQHERKEAIRPPLRRNGTGSLSDNEGGGDEANDKKKDPRLQFRRTVSAPSLNVLKSRKRLVRCVGKKRVHVREVEVSAASLNNRDVYGH